MSFANRNNRDSRDTAKLRAEYDKKVKELKDSGDSATRAKLKDEKQKLFQRVVEQVNHERAESLSQEHKVLARMGRYKNDAQLADEKAKVEAAKAQNISREQRI